MATVSSLGIYMTGHKVNPSEEIKQSTPPRTQPDVELGDSKPREELWVGENWRGSYSQGLADARVAIGAGKRGPTLLIDDSRATFLCTLTFNHRGDPQAAALCHTTPTGEGKKLSVERFMATPSGSASHCQVLGNRLSKALRARAVPACAVESTTPRQLGR